MGRVPRTRGVSVSHRKGCFIEPLEPRRLLAVGVLADINTDSPSHGLAPVAAIGSRMVCVAARAGSTAEGLWATDGTAGGTVRLTAERAANPTLSNGRVFFVVEGTTLWSTDGTIAGTRAVGPLPGATADGLAGSSADVPLSLVDVYGTVYIGGKDGLWRSDGTAAGTVRLLASDGVPFSGVQQPTQRNSDLFFTVTTADHVTSIWRTDGTAAGTFMLRGLDPTSSFVRHGRNL